MPLVDLVMPKMGESIMEATILKWHKQPGDAVKQDETVLEIATDKVDSEVPSIAEGVLEEILFQVNDVVPIGSVIARIRTEAAVGASSQSPQPPGQTQQVGNANGQPAERLPAYTSPITQSQQHTEYKAQSQANRFYSPLVLNIASSEGVPLSELEAIRGSGNEGRVTKRDILQYVAERRPGGQLSGSFSGSQAHTPAREPYAGSASTQVLHTPSPPPPNIQTGSAPQPTLHTGNVEILEMDRMRRLIADHMVRSKHTSPHVTSFTEADVTNMVLWRTKVKSEFEKRESAKLTFTPLFIEAIVHCIKKYPLINSSLDGDKIIIKKDINIGMATALPSGNLIVPVIRNADQLNLVGLTRQVNSLADNARQSKLRPEDTQGGTFTMTNVGTFGSLMGTPIINQPQVAILAVGAIKKRPVVIETAEGDAIAIRHMMYLSLSYDHRIVDGSLGATFLTAVANELENFSPDREF
ncbi:MAG TPA: dihydrolipoamide acetyltransferase family protein [Puia sp.]